jgi:hypothetical protein
MFRDTFDVIGSDCGDSGGWVLTRLTSALLIGLAPLRCLQILQTVLGAWPCGFWVHDRNFGNGIWVIPAALA